MAFAEILGSLLQNGGVGPAQSRIRSGGAQAGSGVEDILGALLGGAGGAGSGGGQGGLGDLLAQMTGGGAPAGRGGPGASIDAMGDLGRASPGVQRQAAPRSPGMGDAPQGGGLGDLLGQLTGGGGAGGGLGDLLGQLAGGAARGAAPSGGGSAGGGLADVLGSLLGGGGAARGGAGGSALLMLAGMALSALREGGGAAAAPAARLAPEEAAAVVDADAARLVLRAMASAAKADGKLDAEEVRRLTAEVGKDGATQEEVDFINAEIARPVDVAGLAAAARTPVQAAQIYAASIAAVEIDTEAERAYLRELAAALRLDRGAVAHLHAMTGAPPV
ncbi:DUF533 domain-containing protein [Rubrimonas cliftonensis]|uniref:Uncharacterized membrane protein YebE, DUF533 family n=1 Tax=Rubrimonas cliftonensis TaxID=89524 RepID=A0A1H3Z971_9RHOB|nr:DUF533 domain-containing protein [Rubrimonas cliftonensis]SEA20276.1 Uncharacterized membrane protein YebE, DUF533 family [Rubrimonas cliftonensis]